MKFLVYKDKAMCRKEIVEYITNEIWKAKEQGMNYKILVSGVIHNDLGLSKRMPLVCETMYAVMKNNDEIIYRTRGGNSVRTRIIYYV